MSTIWSAFLPVGDALKQDRPPAADPAWLAVRGVDPSALQVLQHVRQDVAPLVQRLRDGGRLEGFSFLVHDRASGVPCPPEDTRPYVHLRLRFVPVARRRLPSRGVTLDEVRALLPGWLYVHSAEVNDGCDCATAGSGACALLEQQSALYLRLVEAAPSDDVEALKYVQQHLHFFANMAQMRVS